MKTIKELAEMCDCSKPTINRAIKELNIPTVANKNRILIDDSFCDMIQNFVCGFAVCGDSTATNESKPEQTFDKITSNRDKTRQNETAVLAILENQLNQKDNEINDLRDKLSSAYNTIDQQSKSIIDLSTKIAEMADKAQYITAADKTNQIIDKTKETESATKKWFQFWK